MQNIFIEFLPPWVETGLQPAFYDKESGTVLQQTSRMYAKVNQLVGSVNNQNTIIADYIEQFNVLHDYVHDYFDNLDVQNEIDNKLDSMASDGTLQEIVSNYLHTTAVWCFDDVASMKLSTNLINGSFARTLGYTARGDNGGAYYKVRTITNDDVVDNANIIALADDSLIAELIIDKVASPEMFGAVGDGTTDDTNAFNKMVTSGAGYIQLKKNTTYLISSAIAFSHPVKIEGCKSIVYQSTKRADAMQFTAKASVSGVTFKGTGEGFAGEGEGAGRLVYITADDTTVDKCSFIDGNYVGIQVYGYPKGVNITNCKFDNCWAEGISYLGDNGVIENSTFNNSDYNGVVLRGVSNVVVRNNIFTNIDGSDNVIDLLQDYDNTKSCTDVIIEGNILKSCNRSISIFGTSTLPHVRVSVLNNQIEVKDTVDYATRAYYTNGVSFIGNMLKTPTTTTTCVFSSCKDVKFSDNIFDSTTCQKCVQFSVEDVSCTGNVFTGSTGYAVQYSSFIASATNKILIHNNRFDNCAYGINGATNYNKIVSIVGNTFENTSNPTVKLEGALAYAIVTDNIFTTGSWSADEFIQYNAGGTQYCLIANNNINRKVCSSSTRPAHAQQGDALYDSSLGYMIQWNGTAWVKADGTSL